MKSAKQRMARILTAGLILVVLSLDIMPDTLCHARPAESGIVLRRHKRLSDQRMAELETLIALQHLKGRLVTVPVGFGKVDPVAIGRRRRSFWNNNIESLQRQWALESEETIPSSDDSKTISVILKNLIGRSANREDYQLS